MDAACWCCGQDVDERALTRLGARPEVGVCRDCAHDLDRRSRDLDSGPARRAARRLGDRVRDAVLARGWQQHPRFGPALRRFNRRSPW